MWKEAAFLSWLVICWAADVLQDAEPTEKARDCPKLRRAFPKGSM